MGHGVRVHRPHNHGPRVAYACLLGVLIGLLLELSVPIIQSYWGRVYSFLPWAQLTLFVVPLLILNALQSPCRHWRWCFITGGCLIWSIRATTLLFNPFIEQFNESWLVMLPIIVLLIPVHGSIGGGINIGLLKLKDLIWNRPLCQDGTMCPNCAYDIAHLPQPRCPECGTNFTSTDISPDPPPGRREWKRFAAVASIAAAICAGVYLSLPHVLIPFWAASPASSPWAEAYLSFRPKCSVKILVPYLRTGNDQARVAVASHLLDLLNPEWGGVQADPQTIAELSRAVLRDPDPMVREMAIQSLGLAEHDDAILTLLPSIMEDESPAVRWSALSWLVNSRVEPNHDVTPFLIQALDDPDAKLRGNAYSLLKANTGQAFPYDPTAPRDQRLADQAKWQEWWDARSDEGG